jgi:hypothetical protein
MSGRARRNTRQVVANTIPLAGFPNANGKKTGVEDVPG